jgi:broad specificity phosphatase PhoE
LESQKDDPSKDFLSALVTDIQTTGKFEAENDEDTYQRIIVLRERLLKIREELLGQSNDQKLLVVSHGMCLYTLLSEGMKPGSVLASGGINGMYFKNA